MERWWLPRAWNEFVQNINLIFKFCLMQRSHGKKIIYVFSDRAMEQLLLLPYLQHSPATYLIHVHMIKHDHATQQAPE